MRKLWYSLVVLSAIGIFISLTQISCQKTAAQMDTGTTTEDGSYTLLFHNWVKHTKTETTSYIDSLGHTATKTKEVDALYNEWNVAEYTNGTLRSMQKIPIMLPSGMHTDHRDAYLTPDKKSIFFYAADDKKAYLYICDVDGSNLKKVENTSGFELKGIS